ncbi:hypothetical protein BpHYR1_047247 [Brachionus plicatilis]|uniref:Uncharacterized protein n=1 Tax=Brachionus plicatilis TaxID=10195 RepID=A0A3M7R3H8_BRAPC|nr:hypothetical protein BpHYR1_047247 [Brachionus plicatilis]
MWAEKKYFTMHILGMAYRYKLVDIPEAAKSIPIEKKNKRDGRPETQQEEEPQQQKKPTRTKPKESSFNRAKKEQTSEN